MGPWQEKVGRECVKDVSDRKCYMDEDYNELDIKLEILIGETSCKSRYTYILTISYIQEMVKKCVWVFYWDTLNLREHILTKKLYVYVCY